MGCVVLANALNAQSQDVKQEKYSVLLRARHLEPWGIGYERGYTTLDGLFLFNWNKSSVHVLVDSRLHRFTNNEIAVNQGFGVRYFSKKTNRIYGVNTYYDYRSDCFHKKHFSQIGVGLEILGTPFQEILWDLRLNGYFPIHRKRLIQRCMFDDYIGDYFAVKRKYKSALTGVNLEVGFPLCRNKYSFFYLAFGPYYYNRNCKDAIGGELQLDMTLFGLLILQGKVSYDHIFKGRAQAEIALTFPKKVCKQELINQHIRRHEIVVLDEFCKWRTNF